MDLEFYCLILTPPVAKDKIAALEEKNTIIVAHENKLN